MGRAKSLHFQSTVFVLGRDKGYTVKYNPLPEGLKTVYPESSPNTDIISFNNH